MITSSDTMHLRMLLCGHCRLTFQATTCGDIGADSLERCNFAALSNPVLSVRTAAVYEIPRRYTTIATPSMIEALNIAAATINSRLRTTSQTKSRLMLRSKSLHITISTM